MPGAYAHLNMVMYNTDADNLAASGLPNAAEIGRASCRERV